MNGVSRIQWLFHRYCQIACNFLDVAPRQKNGHLSKADPEPILSNEQFVAHPVGFTKSPGRNVYPGSKMPVKVWLARFFHTFRENLQHTQPHLQGRMEGQKTFQLHPLI